MIKVKSVYAKALAQDGKRYLIELFWPEGVHTRAAKVDRWFAELGPSYDLQRFEFDKSNWNNYKSRYEAEIMKAPDKKKILQAIGREAADSDVTLIYGSRDPNCNHAVIVKDLIEKSL